MSGGLIESWMGIFNGDFCLYWIWIFSNLVCLGYLWAVQGGWSRDLRKGLGGSFKDWITHLWWEQKFSFGLSMLHEQITNLWWPPSPVLESRKQIHTLGCQQEEWGWFFLCWQLSEQVSVQNRDRPLVTGWFGEACSRCFGGCQTRWLQKRLKTGSGW